MRGTKTENLITYLVIENFGAMLPEAYLNSFTGITLLLALSFKTNRKYIIK